MDDIENQKSQKGSVHSRSDKFNEDIRLSQKSLNYEESEIKDTDKEKEGGDDETEPLVSPYKSERSSEKKKKKKSRRSTKRQPKQLSSEKQDQNAEDELEEKALGIIDEENWELLEI